MPTPLLAPHASLALHQISLLCTRSPALCTRSPLLCIPLTAIMPLHAQAIASHHTPLRPLLAVARSAPLCAPCCCTEPGPNPHLCCTEPTAMPLPHLPKKKKKRAMTDKIDIIGD
ncbi:hypothetical protein SLEP1_g55769 [Rubroshorea leprosula]|uniref:Uncharacterized protein n=1 Tax=Rubroshorea leprosula TaxID=152421 RepID=A0AAV5MGS1_9ROSI|nr:hypothetical protein SLEP1_g55769 [Rubroshorea leprosula]